MNKDTIPEGFTLSLAAVDALPVLFFGASCILLGKGLQSVLFILGACLCLWAGLAKVIWKVIVCLKKKNVWFLFMQMRIIMPLGMLLMLLGFAVQLIKGAVSFHPLPFVSGLFLILGTAGMILMMVFAKKLDSSDVRSNWIEQLTNAAAQACFLLCILFA